MQKINSHRFLIINPFGIGDVLFTTPLIRSIKDVYPDSFVGYWCNERVEEILKDNPYIDKTFALSRGDLKKIYQSSALEGILRFWGLVFGIRKARFEICLDFSLDHRYSLISKLLGIKKRIGFNYKKRGRFLTDKIDIEGYNSRHIVEYYLELLKPIGIEPKVRNLVLAVSAAKQKKARSILSSFGISDKDLIIGIAPGAGASWGGLAALKHWPAIKFAQLADRLISDFGARVLILGDASERPIVETIKAAMRHKAVDLAGKTDLAGLSAIINNLRVLITNDGGPLHMAAALGIKTVSFFGPVDPKVYGPYPLDARQNIVLAKDLDCRPCYHNFRISACLKGKECLKEIEVEEALAAVARLLKE